MKNKTPNSKLLLLSALAFCPTLSALAYTATFTDSDTNYLWTDPTIWDSVPSANGSVIINANATAGSSLIYS